MPVKFASVQPTFRIPVEFYIPVDGGFAKQTFHAEIRRVKSSEMEELAKKAQALDLLNRDLLDRVMVGWSGVPDAQGGEAAYSREARIAADEDYPGFEQAIAVAFWDLAQTTQREAAAKNSAAPSATA